MAVYGAAGRGKSRLTEVGRLGGPEPAGPPGWPFTHVVCVHLGQQPDVPAAVRAVYAKLEYVPPPLPVALPPEQSLQLRRDKHRLLLIVDDVWEIGHAVPLTGIAEREVLHVLITTRDGGLARSLCETAVELPPLTDQESVELLTRLLGQWFASAELERLAETLQNLPLSLVVTAGMLRETTTDRQRLYEWLVAPAGNRGTDAQLLDRFVPPDRPGWEDAPTVRDVLDLSYYALPDDRFRDAYRGLSVFRQESWRITLDALAVVWGLPEPVAARVCDGFAHRGLLLRAEEANHYRIHDLIRRHAADMASRNI